MYSEKKTVCGELLHFVEGLVSIHVGRDLVQIHHFLCFDVVLEKRLDPGDEPSGIKRSVGLIPDDV